MSSYVVESVDMYHVSLMIAMSVTATIISTSVIIITIKYLPLCCLMPAVLWLNSQHSHDY